MLAIYLYNSMYLARGRGGLTNSRELAPDVQDHDDGHGQCDDVEKAGGALEYDGVGELDVSREAFGVDADAARDGGRGADRSTQRQRCRAADVGKVTKASHLGRR